MASSREPATMSPMSDDIPIRRSERAKKVPRKYDEEVIIMAETTRKPLPTIKMDRPKRKAAEAAREQTEPEDVEVLQEQLFACMDIDERKEYRGWVELESEPAFFNAMLQDLGAKDFKVDELFGLDGQALRELPQPVHGLLFLYQWNTYEGADSDRQDCPPNLWFGNQTTANACATVALMNIIMNAQGIKLGPELQEFKDTTRTLPPPHRGHALNTHDFIRAIHNSVARRVDLLSEDLLLDNKHEAANKRRRTSSATKKKTTKNSKPRRKSDSDDNAFHYIAFVPVDGEVWELDGLETKPLRIGSYPLYDKDHNHISWLDVANRAIQERMSRENEFAPYNLLAICRSPLLTISEKLGTNLATSEFLQTQLQSSALPWDGEDDAWTHFSAARLAALNLTREKITAEYQPRDAVVEKISKAKFDPSAVQKVKRELRAERETLEIQYVSELATIDEAVTMIRGRQRDYTPAIHQWVRTLAEKGVLRQLIHQLDE
ncbi:cysteine proteinase [Xylariaceae sp. FL1272]|nr:cysteine proteinase [Xylariaceae sp. FL1272]